MIEVFIVFFMLFGILILLPLSYASCELAIIIFIRRQIDKLVERFVPPPDLTPEEVEKLAKQSAKF